jgi:hypothetical protein
MCQRLPVGSSFWFLIRHRVHFWTRWVVRHLKWCGSWGPIRPTPRTTPLK